ncbi:MAG: hypothetical protein IRY94_01825 [Rhodospirillaceae bacterium]|nr:hypothetical protein [Rhodospirillaceae bacterium]
MGWKSIICPREVRLAYKRARRVRGTIRRRRASLLLKAGWPRPLAAHLRREGLPAEVLQRKQGILSLVAGDRFLRYATRPRPVLKLQCEHAGWVALRERGLGGIVPRRLELRALGHGALLEADLLQPVALRDQLAVTLPIVRTLVGAARPVATGDVPMTVEMGLRLARLAGGGQLPASFATEPEIRACFAGPLLTGLSHQDLHLRNVMRDRDGRPVLIDLKSVVGGQVIALDLLNFACKYMASREGSNVVDQALTAQRCDWRIPGIEPVLELVDLPRPLWGQLFALHALGSVLLKRGTSQKISPILLRQLAKVLSRDWRRLTGPATVQFVPLAVDEPLGSSSPRLRALGR